MSHFAPKQNQTMYLGYVDNNVLYLREGLLSEPIHIAPGDSYYNDLKGLLGSENSGEFTKKDVEYGFLSRVVYEKREELKEIMEGDND